MSTAFVTQLRTARTPIVVEGGAGTIALRVEASDLWETARVTAKPTTRVADLRRHVAKTLYGETAHEDEFVLKHRGWELLDPLATLADAGVVDGSIVLVAYRRRRPVR